MSDVAFVGRTAYVLVTLVQQFAGGPDSATLYRIDGPTSATVVADLGAFSAAHPPATDFFVATGVPFALQPFGRGFLVTDGHHNRVLRVTTDGDISIVRAFENIVPTGLATWGPVVLMAQAGPVPHLPETGEVVAFGPWPGGGVREVASGGRLLVDVEVGRSGVYALGQGVFTPGQPEGSPADPDTGSLYRLDGRGGLQLVTGGLDRPTSLEIVRDTAYVVTLDGEVWTVDLSRTGHGH